MTGARARPNHDEVTMMRATTTKLLALAPLLALAAPACGGGDGGGPDNTVMCAGANLIAKEANDYKFSSTLTFPPVAVAPNMELTFNWGGVNKDFVGHTVDPRADIDMVLVMMFDLTLQGLQDKVNADTLIMRDFTTLPLRVDTDGVSTSAKLFSFTLNGTVITPDMITPYFDAAAYPPDTHTYALMAATGMTLGQGTRMIQSFRLDPASVNTTVTLSPQSTQLSYTADLHTLKPVGVPAGQAAVTLDWKEMKTNALGNEFILGNVTDAIVGHYTQTPAELEAKFLDLELIATDLYRGQIATGTVVDFSMLKTDGGKSFTGIDGTGTWIVALRCGGCRNPAPWYLSVLKPCAAAK